MWFFIPQINKVELLWSHGERGTKDTSVRGLLLHPQKVEDHTSSSGSLIWPTDCWRLGNCYKIQVFEDLYNTFLFHKHRLLKSAQQATTTAGLHAFCSSSITAPLIPGPQALLLFEAVAPSCAEWIDGGCLPSLSAVSQQRVWHRLCPQLARASSGSHAASATHVLFAAVYFYLLYK